MLARLRKAAILGIACGLSGPLLGLLILYAVSNVIPLRNQPATTVVPGAGVADIGETFYLYCLYAIVLFGPLATVLGGSASWLLISLHEIGVSPTKIRLGGTLIGAIAGATCVPLSFTIVLSLFMLLSGDWKAGTGWNELWDPRNPYVVTGLVTGLILGALATLWIVKRGSTASR